MALASEIKVKIYRELIHSIDQSPDGTVLSIDKNLLSDKTYKMAQRESAYYPAVEAADLDIWQHRLTTFCDEEGIEIK